MTDQAGSPHHVEPIAHLVPELKGLLKESSWDVLKELLTDISPLDLADSWYQFAREEQLQFFKLLGTQAALALFESLSEEDQTFLVKSLEEPEVAHVLDNLHTPDVARIFRKLPKKAVRKMVSLMKKEEAVQKITLVMTYPPSTAGSLMHTEFIKLAPRVTADDALSVIQMSKIASKNHLRSLYVVGGEGTVIGSIQIEELVTAPPDILVQDLMTSIEPIKFSPLTDQERIAAVFSKYNLVSAPVVDESDHLLGVILIDDIIDVINAEATEDIAKLAGTRVDEFKERSIFRIAWFRAPWLLATLATQVVVSFVIRRFEFILQEIIALATFLPLIAAMGGNVGSQSAMVFVRRLSLGRLKGRAKYLAVLREAATGCVLGLTYGVIVGGIAYALYGHMLGPRFFLVVLMSVCFAMTWAAVAGSAGPIVFEKLGIDPATAMGPMVTTTTDLMSITAYLTLATLLLLD